MKLPAMPAKPFLNPLPLVTSRCDFAAVHGRSNESLCPHHHAVTLVVDGLGQVRTRDGWQQVGPGSLVLVRAGDRSCIALAEGSNRLVYDWMVFHASPGLADWLTYSDAGGLSRVIDGLDAGTAARFAAVLEDLRHWFASAVPERDRLLANTLERLLLLLRLVDPCAVTGSTDPRVLRLKLHMQQYLAAEVTSDDLASLVGLSPSRMIHLFTGEIGISPLRYLERLRLERAAQLLAAPGARIADVAQEVGFADPFHFTRRFTALFRAPPSRWRQQRYGVTAG